MALKKEFTKSSFSGDCGVPFCVACRDTGQIVEVIQSSMPDRVLTFSHEEWGIFLLGAKAGEFDLP
jgi:hypothetical protein